MASINTYGYLSIDHRVWEAEHNIMMSIRRMKGRYAIVLTCFIIVVFATVLYLMISGTTRKEDDLKSSAFPEPLQESQVMKLSVKSEYMGREMPCMIYLPKGYGDGEEYPVWYGLNGYSSSETMWVNNGIAEAADELIEKGEV